MIWDALFGSVLGLFAFVLNLLPAFDSPAVDATDLVSGVGWILHGFNNWFPVSLLFALAGIGVIMYAVESSVRGVQWLWDRLPFT